MYDQSFTHMTHLRHIWPWLTNTWPVVDPQITYVRPIHDPYDPYMTYVWPIHDPWLTHMTHAWPIYSTYDRCMTHGWPIHDQYDPCTTHLSRHMSCLLHLLLCMPLRQLTFTWQWPDGAMSNCRYYDGQVFQRSVTRTLRYTNQDQFKIHTWPMVDPHMTQVTHIWPTMGHT